MSAAPTPEQVRAREVGERLANANHIRRRIDAAASLAELEGVEASMTILGLDDDLKLNQQFERAWAHLDRKGVR